MTLMLNSYTRYLLKKNLYIKKSINLKPLAQSDEPIQLLKNGSKNITIHKKEKVLNKDVPQRYPPLSLVSH